jgi:hypothetical protein
MRQGVVDDYTATWCIFIIGTATASGRTQTKGARAWQGLGPPKDSRSSSRRSGASRTNIKNWKTNRSTWQSLTNLPPPPRDQPDIYLFEVIGGRGESSPDKELFETVFDPNNRLQINFTQQLHLILTTPAEFKSAMEEHWPSAEEIAQAMRSGDYEVLCADKEGKEILERLVEDASRREVLRHG